MVNKDVRILISGHTDNVGSNTYNQNLSQRRAESVKNYLLTKGIKEDRMLSVGMGDKEPILPNDTAENRALNRRITITIL
jgi:outer membrane protein OmpA-like peptidoglycan-associated protein